MTQDDRALSALRRLLEGLVQTLLAEQDAIRRLDAVALGALVVEKEALATEFAKHGPGLLAGARHHAEGPAIRVLAARAQALAHANRLLLDDASTVLGRRLGVADRSLYDARARRITMTTGRTGKTI